MLASEPVGGRSRVTELPCFILWPIYEKLVLFLPLLSMSVMRSYCPEIFIHLGSMAGPPQDPQIWKKCIFLSYFKLKKFLSDCFLNWHVHKYGWEDSWKAILLRPIEDPHRAPQIAQNIHIFLHFGPYMKNWFSNCFPLNIHMSPLWWGVHLLIFRCPWYPWIWCKGPT